MMKRKIKIALLVSMCMVCVPTLYAEESPWSWGIKLGEYLSYMTGLDKSFKALNPNQDVKNVPSQFRNTCFFVRYKGGSCWGISCQTGLRKHVGELKIKISQQVIKKVLSTHNLSIRPCVDLYPVKLEKGHWCISPGIELSIPIRKRVRTKTETEDDMSICEDKKISKGIRSFDIAAVLRTEYEFAYGLSIELWGSYGFLDRIQKSNGAEDKGWDFSKWSAGKQLRYIISLKDEDTLHQVGFGFSLGYNIAKGFKLAQMECPIKDDPAYSW